MKVLLVFLLCCFLTSCEPAIEDNVRDFQTHFELSDGMETATYVQTIEFYIQLAKEFPEINIHTTGITDSGLPLHVVTFNTDGDFNYNKIGKDNVIILINNGIHPGESDGIDATMLLFRDLATKKIDAPKNTVLVAIPVYNVGGALNRNNRTRVNQNGPKSYGFRGNARNYDLNRDFIKTDTKNAVTFTEIYHLIQPDIFIDNHVSNGADYQYTLTHLFTQHNKLGGELGEFLHMEMMPGLETTLHASDWSITPYVNVFNTVPETGFSQFMDHPRYSTGYVALWNTLGLMVETHMLKPYERRVKGTYALMKGIIDIAENHRDKIKELRAKALTRHRNWTHYPMAWEPDSTKTTTLNFLGYEADTITSEVTGFPRLKYDRNRPYTKEITYLNYFVPTDSVLIPKAYIVTKSWADVMERIMSNGIQFKVLEKDTSLVVESYRISSFKTRTDPYEGHYPHYDTRVNGSEGEMEFEAGDYVIPTDQPGIRYIMETLEPAGVDSFFNWNFFDPILQQKEGFSPYVFEDLATEIVARDTLLSKEFTAKKESDTAFVKNGYAQLQWIYRHSEFYEPAHLQYPVYRLLKDETRKLD
ncbi:MAG TPA: M14 family metallopeptidase [Eudoraea sp.]|nr:M14 family metallopeptidase [Eudoraea sp.]